jgi:biopolymer transport protein ExbD
MRPRRLLLAAALVLMPTTAYADVSAGGPATKRTPSPVADSTHCATSPLRFAPVPGDRYAIATWDGSSPADNRGAYRSTIVFSRHGSNGWSAEESDFRRPFAEPAASGLSDARLIWQLDERGLPTRAPEVKGGGNPDVVRNLSLFAFRPMGLTMRSTCVDATGESRFIDAAGRTRAYTFKLVAQNPAHVTLDLEGGVQIPSGNRWRQRGLISLDANDGLSGEARLTVESAALASDKRERMVVIARAHEPGELRVLMRADGVIFCDDVRTDLEGVRARARAAVASDAEVRAVVAADKDATYEKVMLLVDALRTAGVHKISMQVSPLETATPPRP